MSTSHKTRAPRERSRLACIAAAACVIALGLASRHVCGLFPSTLGKYPGDALWALMVYFLWAALRPRDPLLRIAVFALATSYLVEFSQLYQALWINTIRGTTLGHLVLGSAFSRIDLVAYAVGVAAGTFIECLRTSYRSTAA